jgi:hypothetical protein
MNKFTPGQLWSKTMPFIWAKLWIRLAAIGVGAVILGIAILLTRINETVGAFAILIGIILSLIAYRTIVRLLGYAVKVGHIAVLSEAIKTGIMPNNQMSFGKDKVKAKFATAAVFFGIDVLVEKAVKQLQKALGSLFGFFGGLPGMGGIMKIAESILGTALNYVDECCIGWIFYNEDKGETPTKGALDGVVIYFQNWKKVLGGAAKTALLSLLMTLGIGLVLVFLFTGILSLMGGGVWGWLAFFLGLMIAFAIKNAFIDSWVMIRMYHTYLEVAPATEIKFDLYGKLCGLSPSFKKMYNQANAEGGNSFQRASVAGAAPIARNASKPVFCGECGAKNEAGTRFCGECGKPV